MPCPTWCSFLKAVTSRRTTGALIVTDGLRVFKGRGRGIRAELELSEGRFCPITALEDGGGGGGGRAFCPAGGGGRGLAPGGGEGGGGLDPGGGGLRLD